MPLIAIVWGPDETCVHPETGEPRRHADIIVPDQDALVVWGRGPDWHIVGSGRFEDVTPKRVAKALRRLDRR